MYVIATLSVYPHRASLKNMPGHGGIPPWPGIFFKLARCGYTLRVAITYIDGTVAILGETEHLI